MQSQQGVQLGPAQQVAPPQDPQPEVSSFQWLVDLFKSIMHCLCCCFSQENPQNLNGRVAAPVRRDGVPMKPFPADMSFDKLLDMDPRIREWLAAGLVNVSSKFTNGPENIVNLNWGGGTSDNLNEAALRHLCEDPAILAFKNIAHRLQDPNFKYYIRIVIINPRAPNEKATFLWQNIDITPPNN